MARPRGGDRLLDEIKAIREAGVDVLVSLLTPDEVDELDLSEEAAYCHSQDITYLSFPIPDLTTPPFSPHTFTFLEQLQTFLAEGKHVTLHCRMDIMGAGRDFACVQLGEIKTPLYERRNYGRGHRVSEFGFITLSNTFSTADLEHKLALDLTLSQSPVPYL
jgi:hypothetical protein